MHAAAWPVRGGTPLMLGGSFGADLARAIPPLPREAILSLGASRIREIANAAMGRTDVLPFWFGESDVPTADFIRAAGAEALAAGETFYTHNLGLPELRAAIAAYRSRLHNADLTPDRVAVASSGISGLMLTAQMLLSPGDRVVIVTPIWPNVTELPRILGAEVIRVPLEVKAGRWALDLDRSSSTRRTTRRAGRSTPTACAPSSTIAAGSASGW
jgi:aspartate aminotransferase